MFFPRTTIAVLTTAILSISVGGCSEIGTSSATPSTSERKASDCNQVPESLRRTASAKRAPSEEICVPAAIASTISERPFAPAHQGSTCSYGSYSSIAVGLLIPSAAEPDRPGPNGNEVRDIARVFFTTAKHNWEFAGWLTTAFDGRRAFTPAGLASQLGNIPMSISVRVADKSHLPLGAWMRVLTSHHGVFDPALKPLLMGEPAATRVEPCFTARWDGTDGLEEIGRVVVAPYVATLAGVESVDGCSQAYHLILQPKGDAERHALRELWVDQTSGRICRANLGPRRRSGAVPLRARGIRAPG